MSAFAPVDFFTAAAATANIVKTVSDLSQGSPGKATAQVSTPTQATATKDTNASDIQANILKQEQARKAGASSGTTDSILTGGMGAWGQPEVLGGGKTLLGL